MQLTHWSITTITQLTISGMQVNKKVFAQHVTQWKQVNQELWFRRAALGKKKSCNQRMYNLPCLRSLETDSL